MPRRPRTLRGQEPWEGKCTRWCARASNPVRGVSRSLVGSTPAAFRPFSAVTDPPYLYTTGYKDSGDRPLGYIEGPDFFKKIKLMLQESVDLGNTATYHSSLAALAGMRTGEQVWRAPGHGHLCGCGTNAGRLPALQTVGGVQGGRRLCRSKTWTI